MRLRQLFLISHIWRPHRWDRNYTMKRSGSGAGSGKRVLLLEQLERRAMLAGNVNVFVDGGGSLIVRGDNAGNGARCNTIQ